MDDDKAIDYRESRTYELEDAIEVGGKTTATITLRKPRWRDAKAVDGIKGSTAKAEHMIASLAELTPDEIEELSLADFTAISNIIEYHSTPKSERGDLA